MIDTKNPDNKDPIKPFESDGLINMIKDLHSIKNKEITVHFNYLNNSVLKKTIVNNKTGDVLTFESTDEFEIQLEIENGIRVIHATDCKVDDNSFSKPLEANELSLEYYCDFLTVTISYSLYDHLLYKNIIIKMNESAKIITIFTEKSICPIPLTRGGEGQPIFCGDVLFAGIEFPAANNQIEGNTLTLKQSPYVEIGKGEDFQCFPIVFGLNDSRSLEKSFVEYIRKITTIKKSPLKIYCDWGLHDELSDTEKLDYDMAEKVFEKMCEIKNEGFDFQYYLMDAFWYEFGLPYTKFREEGFPEGISPLLQKLEDQSMKFGLWFDINFEYIKIANAEEALLRSDKSKFQLCFSQPKVQEMLENALVKHIEESAIRMIKFDFAYFDCNNKDHKNHSHQFTESKEPAITGFIKMIENIRKKQPDLKILAYNGFTTDLEWIGRVYTRAEGHVVSPWWCLYIDYVYCGDPRPSDISANSLEKSILYYTDAMIFQFKQALFPNEFIDDHGTMVASTGTMYGLGRKGMLDNFILNVVRGTNKMQFYGNLHQLTNQDIPYMKWCEKILFDISDKKMKTDFILGNPIKGETYGYSNTDGKEGYITIINPTNEENQICVKLSEWNHNSGIRIKKIYECGSIITDDEHVIKTDFITKQDSQGLTIYYWELDAVKTIQNTDISLNPGEYATIAVPTDVSIITLYFKDHENKPLRGFNNTPDDIELLFENCSAVPHKYENIWSGISWIRFDIYEIQENARFIIKTQKISADVDNIKITEQSSLENPPRITCLSFRTEFCFAPANEQLEKEGA